MNTAVNMCWKRASPKFAEAENPKIIGDQFPGWFGKLSKLVNLELIDCEKCVQLPVLGHLPCLESLEFSGLKNLISIGSSFYGVDEDCRGGGGSESTSYSGYGGGEVVACLSRRKLFPALKTLELNNMMNLTEWKEAEADEGNAVLPVLEKLTIKDCSQLTTVPTHFPTLKHLSIEGNVPALVVKGILSKVSNTVESLSFAAMNGLACLSDVVDPQPNNTVHLKYLRLRSCLNLTRLRGWWC